MRSVNKHYKGLADKELDKRLERFSNIYDLRDDPDQFMIILEELHSIFESSQSSYLKKLIGDKIIKLYQYYWGKFPELGFVHMKTFLEDVNYYDYHMYAYGDEDTYGVQVEVDLPSAEYSCRIFYSYSGFYNYRGTIIHYNGVPIDPSDKRSENIIRIAYILLDEANTTATDYRNEF